MDRQAAARERYDRLKQTLADEKKVRTRIRGVRIAGIVFAGAWLVVPALLWDVDLASVAQPEFFRTPTPHEAYGLALPRDGSPERETTDPARVPGVSSNGDPVHMSLARAWKAASRRAVDAPASVEASYREIGTFPVDLPQALGLRLRVPEGQRLRLALDQQGLSSGRVFIDLFRAAPEETVSERGGRSPAPALVRGEELEGGRWSFDAVEAGVYVVRIQPELGGVERYDLSVQVGAPWRFPVDRAGVGDIGSVFGDPRDGGRRQHHGVDIFAPRGTPVLAASDGYVRSVDTTNIGGRVVWQREEGGGYSIYYAHLDQILVQDGQRLQAGDTVGLVGNTGNARTTPPHLHFGAYRRGPRDPWNLILPIPPALPAPRYRAVQNDGEWGYVEADSFPILNAQGS